VAPFLIEILGYDRRLGHNPVDYTQVTHADALAVFATSEPVH